MKKKIATAALVASAIGAGVVDKVNEGPSSPSIYKDARLNHRAIMEPEEVNEKRVTPICELGVGKMGFTSPNAIGETLATNWAVHPRRSKGFDSLVRKTVNGYEARIHWIWTEIPEDSKENCKSTDRHW